MGFFGGVFRALGFESEVKTKKSKRKTKATYKLNDERNKRVNQIDGVSVYYPEKLEQFVEFVNLVKNGKPIIISLQDCDKDVAKRIMDYMNGFVNGANTKTVEIEKDLHLLLPEGIEIEE